MLAFVVIVVVCVVLGVWYELRNPAQYEYICPNCGSIRESFIPPQSKNLCLVCSRSELVLTDSARGREIMEFYHGAASAETHFRGVAGTEKKPTEKSDEAVPPIETSKWTGSDLAALVRVGVP